MSKTKDMTTGSIFGAIMNFAVPLLFGMMFQHLYGMVDTIIVGKYLGVDALAAVGSTGSINFMIIGFSLGVCSGFAIPIAQEFGAKNYDKLRKYVANSAYLSIIFSITMTIIVCVFCHQILEVMDTPSDIIEQSYQYIFIIFLGIPVTYLYNMVSGIIRSLGDSKTPLIFLVISSLLNIVLDLLLIIAFKMGVAGAAIATVLSQLVSGILCLIFIWGKYDVLKFQNNEVRVDVRFMKRLCNMGLPMGFQCSITAIGSVIFQTSVNALGSSAVASITASGRISQLICVPYDALGNTMATYAGQNIGARNINRINEGIKKSFMIGAVYSIFALLFCIFLGKKTMLIFVDASEVEVIANGVKYLIIGSSFYIPLCIVNVFRFAIQGMGYSNFAIFSGVFEMVARIFIALVAVPFFGFNGACFSNPAAWAFADVFLIPAYKHVAKKSEQMICMKNNIDNIKDTTDRVTINQ